MIEREQLSPDFMIAAQSDPNIVGQLMAWAMLKETAEWPPESMAHMVQMADKLNYVLGKITPSIPVYEFVEDTDGEEEGDI